MDRRTITFAQAEGMEPLPSQLKPGEITDELRAKLWRVVYVFLADSMNDYSDRLEGDWATILLSWHVDREYQDIDTFNPRSGVVIENAKTIIRRQNYIQVFDYLQYIIRHSLCPEDFRRYIDEVLSTCRSAYRVVDRTILPISEPEEAKALQSGLAQIRSSLFSGAYKHFQLATEGLSAGDFSGSVRESIHAVESACRQLEPSARTLGPALKKLASQGVIHNALKDAFSKLYGYSSDEEGVRHSLVMQEKSTVDEADAIFMLTACVSFVGYLVRKTSVSS